MREIKFRGKSVDGKWIYGSLLQTKTLSFICKAMSKVKTRNYLIEKQETIGEYTGLKDKNGVEIYEGDIVKHDAYWEGDCKYSEGYGQVLWDDEDTGFYLTARDTSSVSLFNLTRNLNAEVIGNIYDNPELLKEEI